MSIIVVNKDLLDTQHGVIIHGCNAQGVFNAGVAKAIAARYPIAKISYLTKVSNHMAGGNKPEDLLGTVDVVQVSPTLWIANAFTQVYYGRQPGVRYMDYPAIEKVFSLVSHMLGNGQIDTVYKNITFPCIGAGLGGGDWKVISRHIEKVARLHPDIYYFNSVLGSES